VQRVDAPMPLATDETGLVLSGGGARASYQVGALRAIAKLLPKSVHQPFPVICGTSAGAINAAMLGTHADSFRRGVACLLRWWRRIDVTDVYRADVATLVRHAANLIANLAGGGHGPRRAATLLDNAPLAELLGAGIDLGRVRAHLDAGHLHALGINATSYGSGQAVTFFEARQGVGPWQRVRRRGERCRLATSHLMASAAIPFVFPAVRVGTDYYMDGSVRQMAPLAPALHLGAKRIVAVAVGQFAGQPAPAGATAYPSLGQVAGHALASVFLDNLAADLERLHTVNRLASLAPAGLLAASGVDARHVDVLVLLPTHDLGELALSYADRLPRGIHYLLRGHGSMQGTGASLLSYLLFDRAYCRELLRQGYADAMARRDELIAFLGSSSVSFIPLFPPELR
jgi:NTE family protein